MSHFTKIKVAIKDIDAMKSVLDSLGYVYQDNALIKGWRNKSLKTDLAIELTSQYGVGLISNSQGHYDVVADWSELKYRGEMGKWNKIMQRYSVELIQKKALLMGYECSIDASEDGSISVTVGGWSS